MLFFACYRYEVNSDYLDRFEKSSLIFSGKDKEGQRMEVVELSRDVHPYFIGVQYHPEYKSRPGAKKNFFCMMCFFFFFFLLILDHSMLFDGMVYSIFLYIKLSLSIILSLIVSITAFYLSLIRSVITRFSWTCCSRGWDGPDLTKSKDKGLIHYWENECVFLR